MTTKEEKFPLRPPKAIELHTVTKRDDDDDDFGWPWSDSDKPANLGVLWRGENWFSFDYIADITKRYLGLSLGEAKRTLRQLCAGGDVRSIVYQIDDDLSEAEEKLIATNEPVEVKPSEWLKEEIDLREGYSIDVSEDDVVYWINKQKPTSEKPTMEEGRTSKKRELALQAIKAIWPKGIPEIPNGEIEKQVGNWIVSYCKQNNLSKLDISSDTILRAAGRK